MRSKKGVLVVLSGFSGAGKGTVMKRLLEKYDNYALSISATTRSPRPGEQEGVSYFYKSVEEFEQMIKEKRLLEYAKYVNNYYGTPKEYVISKLEEGKDVILEIELQGAMQIKDMLPDTVLVFVTPPSAEILKNRLIGRNTEDMETINKRLARASEEAEGMERYDYILINDELEECVDDLHGIIQAEHLNMKKNESFVSKIKDEVKVFAN
ncbi:MAG: guanylate kinase [Lachnospiraceae bacterium]|nr:guanylate kinase [Lachnospiraceae bacterium]